MENYIKEWVPIIISIVALGFSIYATYIKDLRKRSLIKFRETLNIYKPPSSMKGIFPKELDKIFDFIDFSFNYDELGIEKDRLYLFYTITITNYGDKKSETIRAHINRLTNTKITVSNSPLTFATSKASLMWSPISSIKPEYKDGVISLYPLHPGTTITIKIFKEISKELEEVSFLHLISAEKVLEGKRQIAKEYDIGESFLSMHELQMKLQSELNEIQEKSAQQG